MATAAHRQCCRVTVSVEVLQQQTSLTPEEPDEAIERLMARGPNIDMSPEEEVWARSEALEGAVQASAATGMGESYVKRLREVIGRRWNVFRRGLRWGDPPARVEPLRVTLKPGARPVKARLRVYNPIKTAWLAACMASLAALGLVFLSLQAMWASAAMSTPKKGFRMVSDFRAANQQVEKLPGVMPNQEAIMAKLSEARVNGTLDFMQGYWQCPLAPDAQEIFMIVTPGMYKPTRAPQGILNATSYYQATLTRVLEGLNCMVWVDDVIYWGLDEPDLLNTLDLILERLEEVGLYAAAHKYTFFETSITWC